MEEFRRKIILNNNKATAIINTLYIFVFFIVISIINYDIELSAPFFLNVVVAIGLIYIGARIVINHRAFFIVRNKYDKSKYYIEPKYYFDILILLIGVVISAFFNYINLHVFFSGIILMLLMLLIFRRYSKALGKGDDAL
ncbi:MAG: hypothetical protein QM489_02865 [Candidatus Izemoplasma sp.]